MTAQMINDDHGQVTTSSPRRKPPRLCRNAEECFAAGLADAANDPPLTDSQRTRIAALLGPSIRAQVEATAASQQHNDAA
ncbi:hypothetical protein [Microbispora triticiradicis]|uniref:hypothetical protein n=1 Tax=Microbispora triticiradicis TaxID=2200763 RepID=UPI001AD65322|nr:hypothetical protein [Microbispora triticiradicis]MBO4275092.1 hypothetical protein [Microbispora triticiradicis]